MKLLTNQQRLHLVNSEQLFENYRVAQRHAKAYLYGMRWKNVRSTEYLFKDKDRRGNGKSLGRRSPETEALLLIHQRTCGDTRALTADNSANRRAGAA